MTGTRLAPTLVIAFAMWAFGLAFADAEVPAVTNEGGDTITRSQTVTNAPVGSVERNTTDHETRVGNEKETEGPRGNGKVNVNSVGIVIGQQDGRVTEEGVAGRTAQPIVYGPLSYTGEWRFKRIP